MVSDILYSSRSEEWETPQDFFDLVNKEFHFNLDVCADKSNHKCCRYFNKQIDGLKQKWHGSVWCNPPYGKDIADWMKKCLVESRHCNVVVCLVHARTDTKWRYDYGMYAAEIRFVKGRLKFGGSVNSATFPSALLIFKPPIIKEMSRI